MMGWHFLQHSGYREEADSRLITGEVDYYTLWPVATGHHNMPTLFRLIRELVYPGQEQRLHILGKGHWDTDLMLAVGPAGGRRGTRRARPARADPGHARAAEQAARAAAQR